jgi:hypothetical protein
MTAFATVNPAEAAIDPSAACSLAFIGGPLPATGLMAAGGGVNVWLGVL